MAIKMRIGHLRKQPKSFPKASEKTVWKWEWNMIEILLNLGSILGPFWELKGLQKSSDFLDAFFEGPRGAGTAFLGSARRNARAGWGGYRRGSRTLRWCLTRRTRWGGGTLRAFRLAALSGYYWVWALYCFDCLDLFLGLFGLSCLSVLLWT